MLGVLVSRKLQEFDVTAEVGEEIISLGVSEAEFEVWYSGKTPGSTMFVRKLRGEPELEDFGLAFEPLIVFAIGGGCKTRYAYAPTFLVFANTLGEKAPGLVDLEGMVNTLVLDL